MSQRPPAPKPPRFQTKFSVTPVFRVRIVDRLDAATAKKKQGGPLLAKAVEPSRRAERTAGRCRKSDQPGHRPGPHADSGKTRNRRCRNTVGNKKGLAIWKSANPLILKRFLARLARFERATAWFVARYSIQLSYRRVEGRYYKDVGIVSQ